MNISSRSPCAGTASSPGLSQPAGENQRAFGVGCKVATIRGQQLPWHFQKLPLRLARIAADLEEEFAWTGAVVEGFSASRPNPCSQL